MVTHLLNLKKSNFQKKHCILLAFVFFCFTQTNYAQLARHSWLNPKSYNHTICPISPNGYTLAAARQERGVKVRNTIAVLKMDGNYLILNSRIVGLPGGTASDEDFDKSVNFEIHDIAENIISNCYVVCGSISYYSGTIGEVGEDGADDKDPPVQIKPEVG